MAESPPRPRSRQPVRTWPITALVAVIVLQLVAIVAVVHWDGATTHDQELDQLYAAPKPLKERAPGTPIRVWKLATSGVDGAVYGMLYHSRSVTGHDITVSGYLAVPAGRAPAGGRPIVALSHGTVGSADSCAPSRDPGTDAATINPFLAKGWIVASTDFEGIGGTGRHPYLVGESEARSMIDSVRAARGLLDGEASDRYIAWGLSQGGHAALFTRQYAATWAPELTLVGAVGMAPVSDVAAFVADPTIAPQAITLLTVSGYTAAYPNLRAADVLGADGLAHLADVEHDCLGALNQPLADTALSTLRVADPIDVPAWRAALERNDAGVVPSFTPVLLVQGTRDPIVEPAETRTLFDRLCAQGAAARLRIISGASHGDIVTSGRTTYLPWMAARFRGDPVVSNCQSLG